MRQVYSSIVLLLCVVFGSAKVDESKFPDELKKLMNNLHKTCAEENKVDEADITKLKAGEFLDNDKIKCYVKCVMSESGIFDENGKIDDKALEELVPDDMIIPTKKDFANCAKKEEGIGTDNYCEKAYAIVKCVKEADPENFYFA
nr:odorant binding protein 25 [Pachyrhinus yasumatsui]